MITDGDGSLEEKTMISIFSNGLAALTVQVEETGGRESLLVLGFSSTGPYKVRKILIGRPCCDYYPTCKKKHKPSKHLNGMR